MNSEIKRHIDSARQVLVGVVPNPTSQIDQITNALIYKFMDDMDQASIKAGGKPSFFVGELEKYSWTVLMGSRLGNQERMNLYGEALTKFSQSEKLPVLFREIFKSAYLPYRSPEVLGLFLKEIDYFDYTHPEDLGDAYEYLLSIMSSQGDAGQFRTPRHIIDFIVDVVNPTKDDKILDPSCGTAGFLISAFKHILSQHDGKDDAEGKEKELTPDQRKTLMNNLYGYDVDPGMVRIAQVNMYLHGFKNPKIFQYDTLAMEERWNDKFDVILANPPFMSPKGGVRPHKKFGVESNRSEVLFVDYIMNHLRPKGRAGIIVPEGIIFQSGRAYKQLRKNLVSDGLFAVVSLPSGVFNPYAGVKTSILLFDNELAKTRNEILFIKVENDGYSLGAQRKKIEKDDLPEALRVINSWKVGKKLESKNLNFVEKDEIAKDGDYNLSSDRYRIAKDYVNMKWTIVKLREVVIEMKDGGTPPRSNSEYFGGDVYWAVVKDIKPEIYDTKEKLTDAGLKNSSAKVWPVDSVIISLGATIGNVGIARVPVSTKQGISGIIVNKEKILPKFLYYFLVGNKEFIQSQATGASIKEIRPSKLQEILKIPLPPLEIQEQIVKELDGYAGIIAGAKQIVENWKPKIDIDPEWEKVKLPQISENHDNKRKPVTKSDRSAGKYPYYGASGIVDYVEDYIFDGDFLLVSEDGANLLARSTDIAFSISGKNWVNNHAHILKFQNFETQKYVETYINQIEISEFVTGMAQPKLNQQALNTIEIPLPPLEIQKQIVDKIEGEKALVESAKKLIGIYEGKTKKVIDKLWEE